MKTKISTVISFFILATSFVASAKTTLTETQFLAEKTKTIATKNDKDAIFGLGYIEVSAKENHTPNQIEGRKGKKDEALAQVEVVLQVNNISESPLEVLNVTIEEAKNIDLKNFELLLEPAIIESRQARPLQFALYAKNSYQLYSFKYSIEYVAAGETKTLTGKVSSSAVQSVTTKENSARQKHSETVNRNSAREAGKKEKVSWNLSQKPKLQDNELYSLDLQYKKSVTKGVNTYYIKMTNKNLSTVKFDVIFPRDLVIDVISYPNPLYNAKKLGVLADDGKNHFAKMLLPTSHILAPNETIEVKMCYQDRKPNDKERTKSGRLRYSTVDWRSISKDLPHFGISAYLEFASE